MIGVFFGSIILLVVASYILKDTPREGGIINSGPDGPKQWKVERYSNGAIRAEGYIQGFLKDGIWLYYNQNGDTLIVEQYEEGKLISTEEK